MNTGYGISEDEFEHLFDDRRTATRLRRLLRDWQLELDLADPLSIRAVHAAIQDDREHQKVVYQVAMDLWR